MEVLLAASLVLASPQFSWDVVPSYFHCANISGEWNAETLQLIATKRFVVFEKNHKQFEEPINAAAEAKIVESCRKVKALNASVTCLMYVESDWARTYYDLGHWVSANAAAGAALRRPNGSYVMGTAVATDPSLNETANTTFYSYDFSDRAMQQHWTSRITDAVATGYVDGAFVDGDRNGWFNNNAGKADLPSAQMAAFKAGMNQSYYEMALNLSAVTEATGKPTTIITNYPTHGAMALSSGGMVERGMALKDYAQWAKNKCGLARETCVLQWHTDHGTGPNFISTLANFLLGAYEGAWFGVGEGWSGDGENACNAWLHPDTTSTGAELPKEYTNKLGAPLGDYATKDNGAFGLALTRKFASGTRVYVGHNPEVPCVGSKGKCKVGHCIFWGNGDISADNETLCETGL